MDIQNYTTEHRKGQHLLAEERHEIEVRLKDGWSPYRIAKHLGRAYNTIKNEIARGTVYLYNGKVARYKAKAGEQQYKDNRRNSRRQYKRLEVSSFINYVEEWFAKGWSLDASVGKALKSGKFHRGQIVCTKTLYNYVDNGLIGIKNIDLPEKLKRNTKKEKVRKHKRVLGDSIELRPESVELREEFGHWEVDTVLGGKYEDEPCTVTMTERKTRNSIWIKAANHTADAVQEAIQSIMDYFGIKASTVFKSVRSLTSAGFSASPVGKYHCPQTCHGHIGSNPIFTALNSRKSVHAARLISLINVLDDLYIQFLRFSEEVFLREEEVPSLVKPFETLFFRVVFKIIFRK